MRRQRADTLGLNREGRVTSDPLNFCLHISPPSGSHVVERQRGPNPGLLHFLDG